MKREKRKEKSWSGESGRFGRSAFSRASNGTADRVAPAIVIGVGNGNRRDDGAGLACVRELRASLGDTDDVKLVESDGDPTELLEHWTCAPVAIVVDASSSGAAPGTVTELDASTGANGHGLRASTHAMGVMEAVQLGKALGRMPARLRIFAIEGEDFSFGEGLTDAVREAVAEVVARVKDEVESETHASLFPEHL